jgi:hypothetical protein
VACTDGSDSIVSEQLRNPTTDDSDEQFASDLWSNPPNFASSARIGNPPELLDFVHADTNGVTQVVGEIEDGHSPGATALQGAEPQCVTVQLPVDNRAAQPDDPTSTPGFKDAASFGKEGISQGKAEECSPCEPQPQAFIWVPYPSVQEGRPKKKKKKVEIEYVAPQAALPQGLK